MSLIRPFLTTAGATLALGVIGTVPASAAQLEFTFSTAAGGTGSFTLDTSIPDSDPVSGQGQYQNAITNFQYSGLGFSAPLNLVTLGSVNSEPRTGFFTSAQQLALNINFSNSSLADSLSDNPADYPPIPNSGNFGGYGGGFESLPGGFNTPVTSVSVQRQGSEPVPEPETVLGSLAGFSFLGILWIKKRLQHRQPT